MLELIKKIHQHTLGNKDEAFSLYFTLCDCLKEKYGLVDRDYDENPTKRGKEWLDIHHIKEHELDDIARRTENAKYIKRLIQSRPADSIIAIKTTVFHDDKAREDIRKLHPNAAIYGLDYSLEELKPYNVKEQLVYANKIEHFLLHYLIETIRGRNVASGGPNYLWDCSIALDVYGFDQEYINNLQSQKENFYSVVSSEEITRLYKKLIDWKNLNLQWCERYWYHYKNMLMRLHSEKISYVSNKDKFFNLFGILDYYFKKEDFDSIEKLPYKVKS